ncbi:hypothetical protein [Tenacibaculum xiamenense]|uniref:hypothetical protein n=1 Tax=Tenacibaculum xiamenense TaxID=1261553 RepID=UPI00389566B0
MNVIRFKLTIITFLFSFLSNAQTINDDAFYILDKKHKDYILKPNVINNKTSKFRLYNRTEYENREKKILRDKKEGTFYNYQLYKRPKELIFRKVYGSKIEYIKSYDINSLNLVDYKWLQNNSWKEHNPNILFKDLYFLLKVDNDKYLKVKVKRTVIAY